MIADAPRISQQIEVLYRARPPQWVEAEVLMKMPGDYDSYLVSVFPYSGLPELKCVSSWEMRPVVRSRST